MSIFFFFFFFILILNFIMLSVFHICCCFLDIVIVLKTIVILSKLGVFVIIFFVYLVIFAFILMCRNINLLIIFLLDIIILIRLYRKALSLILGILLISLINFIFIKLSIIQNRWPLTIFVVILTSRESILWDLIMILNRNLLNIIKMLNDTGRSLLKRHFSFR